MSRRDDALAAVVDGFSSLRTELGTALATAQQPTGRLGERRPSARLASRLGELLDLPPPPSSPSDSATMTTTGRAPARPPALARLASDVPFASASHTTSDHLPPSPSSPSSPSSSRPYPHQFSSSSSVRTPLQAPFFNEAEPPEGDALPIYSYRAPIQHHLLQSLPPKRIHTLTSKSGKLALELKARGKEHVVLAQEQPDSEVKLSGKLKVTLPEPEGITHIRVRIKGVVRTLVSKAQVSGRTPISDEVTFLSTSKTLWTSTPSSGTIVILPGNASSDLTRLHGTFSFPFTLSIPGQITHLPSPSSSDDATDVLGEPLTRPIRPPPSFMLDPSSQQNGASGMRVAGLAPAEAACRYYLKVTLGRKGLLKVNERWIIPLVFAPRQRAPTYSPLREAAILSQQTRLPSSLADPSGWTAPGKYLVRETMRAGVFRTKVGEITLEGRVPRGKVPRGVGEKVEFEIVIRSSNHEQTGRFPAGAIQVALVMRTNVTAQKLTNTIDTPLLRASSVRPIGPPGGEPSPYPTKDGAPTPGWKITYGGSLKLTAAVGSSFAAPNLAVGFLLFISVFAPSSPLTPTADPQLLTSLAVPLEIVACAPRAPVADVETAAPLSPPHEDAVVFNGNGNGGAAVGAEGGGGGGGETLGSPPPPAPPTKSPPVGFSGGENGERDPAPSTASAPPPHHSNNLSAVLPPAPAPAPTPPPAQAEDEWGLPPSYFDVVAVEGGGRRGR